VSRVEKRLNGIVWLTALITAATLILAAIGLPQIVRGADNTAAQRRSDDISACRSEYRSGIDDASLRLDQGNAQSLSHITNALAAVALDDNRRLAELAALAPSIEASKTDALDDLSVATKAYAKAVKLSRQDPSRFLELCKRRPIEAP
jgi:hypothetical protein